MKQEILEYGMHIVGKNLGLIEKRDFGGLKGKILNKVIDKFATKPNFDARDLDLNSVLIGAAERLEKSTFFFWRKGYALEIYRHVDYIKYEDKINELEKSIENDLESINEANTNISSFGTY